MTHHHSRLTHLLSRFTFYVLRFTHAVLAAALVACLFSVTPAHAASVVRYVAPNGSDSNGACTTPNSPCRTIQRAVDTAASGDTILVAAGTYSTEGCADPISHVVCISMKNLTLLGGYTTGFVTAANPVANPTIIDGSGVRRGMRVRDIGAGLWLEGFTIQNGYVKGANSNSDADSYAFGGGLYVLTITRTYSINLHHIVFKNNKAVGGNTTKSYGGAGAGGAIAIANVKSVAQLVDVTFTGNQALGGSGSARGGDGFGGALWTDSSISGSGLVFDNNLAQGGTSTGSGMDGGRFADGLGGAVGCAAGSTCNFQFISASNNTAKGGSATNSGGAFGGAFFTEDGVLGVKDSSFRANLAVGGSGTNTDWGGGLAEGGAFQSMNSIVSLDRVEVISNTARGGNGTTLTGSANGGGAAFTGFTSTSLSVSILNSVFAANVAEPGTGASPRGGGGALWLQIPTTNITHTTFAGNSLGGGVVDLLGSAILLDSNQVPGQPVANIKYSIFSDHSDGAAAIFALSAPFTANLNRCLFANAPETFSFSDTHANSGTTINNSNPVAATSVDYVSPGAPNFNYGLTASSPAIDAASGSTTAVDLQNKPRTTPDIGAVEYINLPLHTFLPFVTQ